MMADGSGRPIVLGERLGRGGEGEVFAIVGRPDLVAKRFTRRDGKAAKLAAMLANPPPGVHGLVEGFPVLTWPRDLLRDGGEVVGYTMARVQTGDFVPWHAITSATRRAGLGGQALTFDKLVTLGLRLAHVVATLHRLGYAVGDLNDRNVLVSRRLTPLLMDTDSFQVPDGRRRHPCTVGDALYWPAELLDADLAKRPVDRQGSDRFALATLLFQLFMAGLRPYQARGSAVAGLETLAQRTRAGHYPWAKPRPGVLEPPAAAPSYAALPRALRDAFERAFVAGHRKPAARPSADDWVRVLSRLRDAGFRPCPREARHAIPAAARSCPWCADPNDPFTAPRAQPVVRVALRKQAPVARLRPKSAPQGPPPAPTKPPMPQMAQNPVAAVASRARPKKRSAPSVARRGRNRRRPAKQRWPVKARLLAALTTGVLVAWWAVS